MKENISSELTRIVKPIMRDLHLVEKELKKQIQLICRESLLQYDPWLKHPVSHFFHVRGKYLRPIILLLSAKALDPQYAKRKTGIIQTAAAIELMHSASLVHDDVIDEAGDRRGGQSLNSAYGNKIAVLVGDLLYSRFFSVATHLESVEFPQQVQLFDLFCETTQKMCLGEISEERLLKTSKEATFEDYLTMIEYKTGSLMAASCEAAAILLKADEKKRRVITEYGMNLGLTYQIVDDVIDQDSVFNDNKAMLEKAEELGNHAIHHISSLQPDSQSNSFSRLVEYILQRVEDLREKAIA